MEDAIPRFIKSPDEFKQCQNGLIPCQGGSRLLRAGDRPHQGEGKKLILVEVTDYLMAVTDFLQSEIGFLEAATEFRGVGTEFLATDSLAAVKETLEAVKDCLVAEIDIW